MRGEKFRRVVTLAAAASVCLMQKGFAQGDISFENRLSAEALSVGHHMTADVKKFLGRGVSPDSCSGHKIPLAEFVLDRMVLPDDIYGQDVGNGRKLYIGHMPHNATDVAAVIYGSDGRISAVAVVPCSWQKTGPGKFDRAGVFNPDIYVRDDAMKDDNIKSLKPWSELFYKLNTSIAERPQRIHLVSVKAK